MKHTIQLIAKSKSYYVSAGCTCGNFSFYRNLPKSRGYKTDAVQKAKEEFKLHKLGAK